MFSPASSSFLHKRGVARLAIGVIDPQAWVIDDTGQAKEGTASACVARQYSGTSALVSRPAARSEDRGAVTAGP